MYGLLELGAFGLTLHLPTHGVELTILIPVHRYGVFVMMLVGSDSDPDQLSK